MSEWSWCFEPSDLAEGLPVGAVAEVERLASELAAMGVEADQVGHPQDRPGGLREFPLGNGVGFFSFLVAHRLREIVIVQVTLWPHRA